MAKVAKLVYIDLVVRVIVDENATEEEIAAASYHKVQALINNRELGENITNIKIDTEVPYLEICPLDNPENN